MKLEEAFSAAQKLYKNYSKDERMNSSPREVENKRLAGKGHSVEYGKLSKENLEVATDKNGKRHIFDVDENSQTAKDITDTDAKANKKKYDYNVLYQYFKSHPEKFNVNKIDKMKDLETPDISINRYTDTDGSKKSMVRITSDVNKNDRFIKNVPSL